MPLFWIGMLVVFVAAPLLVTWMVVDLLHIRRGWARIMVFMAIAWWTWQYFQAPKTQTAALAPGALSMQGQRQP